VKSSPNKMVGALMHSVHYSTGLCDLCRFANPRLMLNPGGETSTKI
jgi:hypothetical protein